MYQTSFIPFSFLSHIEELKPSYQQPEESVAGGSNRSGDPNSVAVRLY